jgi:NitT/TauT family transport system substrate-binding protein
MRRSLWLFVLCLCAVLAGAGCRKAPSAQSPFRLGFFPNLTHAQALVGNDEGAFAAALPGKKLEVKQFNAGPAAMEALLAGAVDLTYVGNGPAITAFIRSHGGIRIISGSASGGAVLVVRSAKSAQELSGKKLAIPQIGNSQDISLRRWLLSQGLKPADHGGTVEVIPQANPEIVTLFGRGEIEGAWVPEPWGARLVELGGKILVDERDLWKDHRFPTTVVVATRQALEHRREDVKALLRVHVALTERARKDPAAFAQRTNEAFARLTGKPITPTVLEQSFSRMELLTDPLEDQLREAARHAAELEYIPSADITGLVDARLLEELRAEARPGVGGSGSAPQQ